MKGRNNIMKEKRKEKKEGEGKNVVLIDQLIEKRDVASPKMETPIF
jgi:hypothetical protein